MKVAVPVILLVACGGRLAGTSSDPDGGVATIVDADGAASSPDAGACQAPAGHDDAPGACVRCGGQYYCSDTRLPPAPACKAGIVLDQGCTTTCIACPGDGVQESSPPYDNDAWLWQCVDGAYSYVVSFGDSCPQ